jgi:hypothetical protein
VGEASRQSSEGRQFLGLAEGALCLLQLGNVGAEYEDQLCDGVVTVGEDVVPFTHPRFDGHRPG